MNLLSKYLYTISIGYVVCACP